MVLSAVLSCKNTQTQSASITNLVSWCPVAFSLCFNHTGGNKSFVPKFHMTLLCDTGINTIPISWKAFAFPTVISSPRNNWRITKIMRTEMGVLAVCPLISANAGFPFLLMDGWLCATGSGQQCDWNCLAENLNTHSDTTDRHERRQKRMPLGKQFAVICVDTRAVKRRTLVYRFLLTWFLLLTYFPVWK